MVAIEQLTCEVQANAEIRNSSQTELPLKSSASLPAGVVDPVYDDGEDIGLAKKCLSTESASECTSSLEPVKYCHVEIGKEFQSEIVSCVTDNVFRIVITDEAGIELYNADVKGDVFSKQFLLNTEDLGDAILHFEITGRKSGRKALYKVSRQRQVTQQMDVVKL